MRRGLRVCSVGRFCRLEVSYDILSVFEDRKADELIDMQVIGQWFACEKAVYDALK